MTVSSALLTIKLDVALLINAYLNLKIEISTHYELFAQLHSHIKALDRWLVLNEILQEADMRAAQSHYRQVIVILSQNEKKKSRYQQSILCIFARLGYAKIIAELLENDVDVNISYGEETPLLCASRNGHTETVRILINHGAYINAFTDDYFLHPDVVDVLIGTCTISSGTLPLMLFNAARRGRHELAERLIKARTNIEIYNKDHHTPLMVASFYGHVNVVQSLLKAGAQTKGALCQAVKGDHIAVIDALSSRVSTEEISQATLSATLVNRPHLVTRLCKMGGNPNGHVYHPDPLSDIEDTLLLWSAENNHPTLVKSLLNAGANPNLSNIDGFTPLMFAGWTGRVETLQDLLKADAAVNAQNKYGSTALMWAVEGKHYNAACILILGGADLAIENKKGETALEKALRSNDMRMANLLYTGRIRQLYLMLRQGQVETVRKAQKEEKINKSHLVNYILSQESDPHKRLELLRYATATDKTGKPTNGLSQFMHISQGLGLRRFFCREASWAVARIKSEIHKIEHQKSKFIR